MVLVAFQELGNGLPTKPSKGYVMFLGKSRKLSVFLFRNADGNSRFRGHENLHRVTRFAARCSNVSRMMCLATIVKRS